MITYVVAAMHGDETFGLKVLDYLLKNPVRHIKTRIGHPEAIKSAKRYIESDLNRSFRSRVPSLEAALANGIDDEIKATRPDYIIDIHTSISNVKKVAIVANDNPTTRYLAQALGMQAMVVMPKSMVKHSLIGCYPEQALSIELGRDYQADKYARAIATRIEKLSIPAQPYSTQLPVFTVVGKIDKSFAGLDGIANLVFNRELNGYPFLAGPKTYTTIGGFLAQPATGNAAATNTSASDIDKITLN